MNLNEETEALRRIPLLAGVDLPKLKLLAFASERLVFEPGQTLMTQGEMGDAAYLLLGGGADVVVEIAGQKQAVARVERNAFVGEMAILRETPRNATVIATEPVTALKLRKDVFLQLLRDAPDMALGVMRELARRLDETTAKLSDAQRRLKGQGGA